MKKLIPSIFLFTAIVLMAAQCPSGQGSGNKPSPAQNSAVTTQLTIPTVNCSTPAKRTLNGLCNEQASAMVDLFLDDNMSSSTKTNFWFSKDWVDHMYELLIDKHGSEFDGFRVYFAKDVNNKNAVVIVATKQGSNGSHLDTLLSDSYLRTVTEGKEFIVDYKGASGAYLYNGSAPCSDGTSNCVIDNVDGHQVSCKDGYDFVQNFMKKIKPINANSEWFEIGVLNNIYQELKTANEQQPVVPGDGVRMYFGKNKKRHTFVLVTTKKDASSPMNHLDNYNCYVMRGLDDNGELCPNHCEGSGYGN